MGQAHLPPLLDGEAPDAPSNIPRGPPQSAPGCGSGSDMGGERGGGGPVSPSPGDFPSPTAERDGEEAALPQLALFLPPPPPSYMRLLAIRWRLEVKV